MNVDDVPLPLGVADYQFSRSDKPGIFDAFGVFDSSHDLSDVARVPTQVMMSGCEVAVSDESLAASTQHIWDQIYLDMRPDDALTPEQLEERMERRTRLALQDLEREAKDRELLAAYERYATAVGGPAAKMIRHHLPELDVKYASGWSRSGFYCPGCDGGPDEGGYFPCSTLETIRSDVDAFVAVRR